MGYGRMSNYPGGFSYGVNIKGMPVLNTYPGNVYWVDSVAGSDGNKGTFDQPFASIDYAVGRCTANNGDLIIAKPGHIETVIEGGGLDLDVAGITIIFMGEGTDKAYVTFTTAVTADMDVGAANVTLVNPKFVAGIDSLTGPIDVNSTDFTIINGEYHDATDVETTDCVIADSSATRLCIDGWKYFCGTETGDQKQSNIQLNGCDDIVLRGIDIRGNFFVGCIENVTDEVLNARFEDIYLENLNTTPKPALFLDASATGACKNVKLKVYSGSTYSNSVGKMSWDGRCEGFMGDGYAGEPLGTVLSTGIEGKVDAGISNIRSDLTVIDAAIDSDMVVLVEHISNIRSDLVVIDAAIDSDMTVLTTHISNIRSDLTVIDAAIDSDMTVLTTHISNIRSDLTVIDAAIDSDMVVLVAHVSNIRSDLTIIETKVIDIGSDLNSLIDGMAVAKIVSDVTTSDASVIILDISDVGVLTGITQRIDCSAAAATGTLTLRIDGTQVITSANFTACRASDTNVTALNFNHPFKSSLVVSHEASAAGSLATFVAYTTD